MVAVNWQTWTRLQRLQLQAIAGELGAAAMASFKDWPPSGEGRAVKAASERIIKLLARAHATSDLAATVNVLNEALAELDQVTLNNFFHTNLASVYVAAPLGKKVMLGERVHTAILQHRGFLADNELPRPINREPPLPIRNPPPPRDTFAHAVPVQKAGPARFAFTNDRLIIEPQLAFARSSGGQNAHSARAALIELGDDLVGDFSLANYDRRLLRSITRVQQKLKDGTDIIQVGIAAMACSNIANALEDELSDAITAQIDTYNVGVSLYLGQFAEWSSFVEDAQATQFSTADADRVISTGKVLAASLREQTELVDPEVPRTIELMVEAMGNPHKSTQRAFFAAVRTFENIASAIFGALGGLVDATWGGIEDGAKQVSKTVTVVVLLATAAAAATSLAPATGGVAGASWLRKAGKMATEAISKIDVSKADK